MADPHWTSYIGMVSGVIGVLVASFSLHKTNKIKTLDLRIELRRSVLDLNLLHEALEETLQKAKKSRENMSAAMGRFRSGGMKAWLDQHSKDVGVWLEMNQSLPAKDCSYKSLNSEQLEQNIVETHEQQRILKFIEDRYINSINEDQKNGEFLREQAHKQIPNST